jgi:hypothetical protein
MALGLLAGCAWWRAPSAEKAGPVMLNARGGVSVGLKDTGGAGRPAYDGASIELELGFAVSSDRQTYLLLDYQPLITSYYAAFMGGVGVEHDFRISERGYVSLRLTAGYAPVTPIFSNKVLHFGWLLPELGLKWVLGRRVNLGFDFFSLPMGWGNDDNGVGITAIFYRIMLFVGVNL